MIRIIGDRVLVALPPREDVTVSAGGIVLVKDPDRLYAPSQGIVMALGEKSGTVDLDDVRAVVAEFLTDLVQFAPPMCQGICDKVDRELLTMVAAPFDVAIGDCVLFPRSAGEEIHDDGIDYVVLRESEIIGIVEPTETEAA